MADNKKPTESLPPDQTSKEGGLAGALLTGALAVAGAFLASKIGAHGKPQNQRQGKPSESSRNFPMSLPPRPPPPKW